MVRGKQKFPFYDAKSDQYYHSQSDWDYYLSHKAWIDREREEKRKREALRAELLAKINALGTQIEEAVEEKRSLDDKMEEYVDGETRELRTLVEDYELQIAKLELARELCKKTLIASRREATQKFKQQNPFTKLKILQNKYDRLLYKYKYA